MFDLTILTQVRSDLFGCEFLEIIDLNRQDTQYVSCVDEKVQTGSGDAYVSNIHIPRASSGYNSRDARGTRSAVLAPADFEAAILDSDALRDSCVHQS